MGRTSCSLSLVFPRPPVPRRVSSRAHRVVRLHLLWLLRFGNNSSYNNNNSRRTSRFGEGPSGGGRDRYAGSMMGSPRVNVATLSRPDQETSLRDASAPSQPGMLQPRPPVMSSAGGYGAPRYAGSMAAAGQATMRMGGRAALLEEDREMDDVEVMISWDGHVCMCVSMVVGGIGAGFFWRGEGGRGGCMQACK